MHGRLEYLVSRLADIVSAIRTLTSLDVSSNEIGELVPPEGWSIKYKGEGYQKYVHTNGREQTQAPEGSRPVGAIALADAIKNNGALDSITFGDKEAATMKTDMTQADLSGKELGASGAIIVAAFLPKCQ